jgi:regulator of sigma E protease
VLLTAVVFVFILGILIFVHELGHFLAAKKVGVRVEEFGFGYPPRVWGKRCGETLYSINAVPFGGFVKLTGEDETESLDPRSFASKTFFERGLVLISSILANFFLAVLIFSAVFTIGVPAPVRVTIEEVVPGSPAEAVGLQKEDIVSAFNKEEIKDGPTLVALTKEHLGEEISLTVLRGEEELKLEVVPRSEFPKDQGPLGVVIRTHLEKKSYPIWQAPFVGIAEALNLTWLMLKGLSAMIFDLIFKRIIPKDIAGPVGIAQLTGEAVRFGALPVFQLIGLLSLNLALVNLLPLPALDGGRLLFVSLEAITGRKPRPKVQKWVHTAGFALLVILMILITIQDINRILTATSFSDSIRGILPSKQ